MKIQPVILHFSKNLFVRRIKKSILSPQKKSPFTLSSSHIHPSPPTIRLPFLPNFPQKKNTAYPAMLRLLAAKQERLAGIHSLTPAKPHATHQAGRLQSCILILVLVEDGFWTALNLWPAIRHADSNCFLQRHVFQVSKNAVMLQYRLHNGEITVGALDQLDTGRVHVHPFFNQ